MNERSDEDNRRPPARKKTNERSEEDKKTTTARKEDKKSLKQSAKSKDKSDEECRKAPTGKHATKGPLKFEEDNRKHSAKPHDKTSPARKQNDRFEEDNRKSNERKTNAESHDGNKNTKPNDVRIQTYNAKKEEEDQDRARNHSEEDDKCIRTGVSSSPPRRKAQSYSQQLRTNTAPHNANKRQHQLRKHSLDENRILNHNQGNKNNNYYNDSSDEDDFYPYSTVTGKTLYDHHVDNQRIEADGGGGGDDPQQPLMEFMGNGGGIGIFKAPSRAPVNPNRPPCIELRPHPLRETQVGRFIRTITSTESQLWAGQESGVRVWNYADAYNPGLGTGGRARRGDEDAAPFIESSSTPPTICLIVDQGSKLVWSGHKDGKIRSWKMDLNFSDENGFRECFCWQAHRGPILSMDISSYGK